jgi:MFS family permease
MIRDRRAILALLTALNFLNYIDRAVIAAVLPPIQAEFALSNFKAGILNAAFLVGYFATCPLFGLRADKGARKGLIALGVAIWSAATVGSGLATGFWTLLAARIVVGVGEASFTTLAPTIIDDLTPPERKGSALSMFYLGGPLGYAMGYMIGGEVAKHWDWHTAFYAVGGPGIAFALCCLLIAEPSRKLLDAKASLVEGFREIAAIPLFRRAVLGFCTYTAAVVGFSYWGPKFLLRTFSGELDIGTANLRFGIVLMVTGAIGTVVGGLYANRVGRNHPVPLDEPHDSPANKRAVNALLRICAVGMTVAAPVSAVGFFVHGATAFFIISFIAQIGLFATTAPLNAVFLRSVPVVRRASAMAASIFTGHLLGDLWSVAALGLLLDALEPRIAMMALPLTFAWTVYIWWPRQREASGSSPGTSRPGGLPEARVHPT